MKTVILFLVCAASGCDAQDNTYTYTLYTMQTPNGTTNITLANPSNPTVILVHGWEQAANQSWIIGAKKAHLSLTSKNVITLDWSQDAMTPNYLSAAAAVPTVATYLAKSIYDWSIANMLNVATTKLVGMSLGAHVCGIAGQEYQSLTGGEKLPNIIGLEPAGPLFNSKPVDERLDASDATMVQVFHTSTTGIYARCGTVDVYFSSASSLGIKSCAKEQPGCPFNSGVLADNTFLNTLFCNHIRSAALYVESITSQNFLATPCTCDDFKNGMCAITSPIVVGDQLPATTPNGEYYLRTSAQSPFALGTKGLTIN